MQASGLSTYVKNGRVLAEEGEGLRVELEREIAAVGGGAEREVRVAERHWSEEYQRWYVYDNEKGISVWVD